MNEQFLQKAVRKKKINLVMLERLVDTLQACDIGLIKCSDGYEYVTLFDHTNNPLINIRVSKTCYLKTDDGSYITETDPFKKLKQIIDNFDIIKEIETGIYKFGRIKLVENGFISWSTGEHLHYEESTTNPIEIYGRVLNVKIISIHKLGSIF